MNYKALNDNWTLLTFFWFKKPDFSLKSHDAQYSPFEPLLNGTKAEEKKKIRSIKHYSTSRSFFALFEANSPLTIHNFDLKTSGKWWWIQILYSYAPVKQIKFIWLDSIDFSCQLRKYLSSLNWLNCYHTSWNPPPLGNYNVQVTSLNIREYL